MARVDAHVIQPHEYDELPEMTDEMIARGVWKRGVRRMPPPMKVVTLRLRADVIAKWRATGPGWQARMAARLSRVR